MPSRARVGARVWLGVVRLHASAQISHLCSLPGLNIEGNTRRSTRVALVTVATTEVHPCNFVKYTLLLYILYCNIMKCLDKV